MPPPLVSNCSSDFCCFSDLHNFEEYWFSYFGQMPLCLGLPDVYLWLNRVIAVGIIFGKECPKGDVPLSSHHVLATWNSHDIPGGVKCDHLFKVELARFLHCKIVQSLRHVSLFVSRGRQHARLPCPPPSSGACSDSCPLSRWCHPASSSSVSASPPALNLSQHQGLF